MRGNRTQFAAACHHLGQHGSALESCFARTAHWRIHRIGQTQPVQIINFVAKGTIEEGMLAVLAFKRSLSAGILDGGASEISLGGSRLSRFMKEVENVTGQMGESEAMTPAEETAGAMGEAVAAPIDKIILDDTPERIDEIDETQPDQAAASGMSPEPWAALLQLGTHLVSALTSVNDNSAAPHPWIDRDPASGTHSLKIPLPSPETTQRLADALSAIADSLRAGHRK